MKFHPAFYLFAAPAVIGYVVGTQVGTSSPTRGDRGLVTQAIESHAVSDSETSIASQALRDPRTGATFVESRERLIDLARSAMKVGGVLYILERRRHGHSHLEIERIFALASQEDLIAFFAEENVTDDPIILSAAFGRFAALSPEVSVSVWQDLFRRTGRPDGVHGLVGAWAQLDSSAAELWVDSLEDSKIRNEALAALFTAVVEIDPALVERRITDLEEIEVSMDLISRLGWQLEPTRFSALATRILAEKRGNWSNQNQLAALLEVWAERDSTAMFAWILDQPAGGIRDHVVSRVAEAGATADPAAFVRAIGPSLDQNPALAEMAGKAWMTWLAGGGDDDAAMAWFQSHGAKMKVPMRNNWYPAGKAAERVLERLSTLPVDELTRDFTRMVLDGLAMSDPESALRHALERMPEGREREVFLTSTVHNIAQRGDPGGALEWAVANLPAGQGQIDAVGAAMRVWAGNQPRLAVDRAMKLPASLRDWALGTVAYEWSQRSPDQVAAYLTGVSDPAAKKMLARNAYFQFGFRHGGESYLGQTLVLPDETIKAEAVRALFDGWSQANLETSGAALKSIDPGPLRDGAIEEFVGNAARTDRVAALAWSLEIENPEKRREVTMQQSRYWLFSDREAATRWIESSEDLPAEWKAELLKKGK
jgi:hypothetical protein